MANPSFSYLPKWEKVDKICVDAKQKTEQFQNSVQTQKQYIKCHGFISFFSCFLILTSNIPIPIRIRNIFKWLEIQEYYQKKIKTFPFFSFRRAIKFCTNWKHIHRRCLCMGFWCYRWLSNAFCFCNTLPANQSWIESASLCKDAKTLCLLSKSNGSGEFGMAKTNVVWTTMAVWWNASKRERAKLCSQFDCVSLASQRPCH